MKKLLINFTTLILMIVLQLIVDSIYYKKLTLTTLNFFEFNFLEGLGSLYGVHHISWYFL